MHRDVPRDVRQPPPLGLAQTPALAPGTKLVNRYLIQGYIGGGGFGHIYLANDTALGHRRAIKEAFSQDPAARHQFRLEAEFLLNARHPNLVRGYAVFEVNGRLYLVMDYVDGQTLEDVAIQHIRATGHPLAEAQVLDWMIPICEAVAALHQQPVPIIHRDIKPANIKLSATYGIPILMDLGLAKLQAAGTRTLGAALAFTPGYAPPEQYQASGATDVRTDVYGLGASLYFLLTGYQPIESPARLSAQALRAPRALNPALHPLTERAVLRAMELNPATRQQDTLVLARELRAARAAVGAPMTGESGGRLAGCPSCGTPNPARARFCLRCGVPMDGAGDRVGESAPKGQAPHTPAAAHVRHGGRDETGVALPEERPRAYPRAEQPVADASTQPPPVSPAPPADDAQESPIIEGAETAAAPPSWHGPAASPREAWITLFAFVAGVCFALSLTSIFARPLLIFLAPALALGHWALAQPETRRLPGPRWLALITVAASYLWLLVWIIVLVTARR